MRLPQLEKLPTHTNKNRNELKEITENARKVVEKEVI